MPAHITGEIVKLMTRKRIPVDGTRILVLGTNENCSDIRNSKVIDEARELKDGNVATSRSLRTLTAHFAIRVPSQSAGSTARASRLRNRVRVSRGPGRAPCRRGCYLARFVSI